MERGCLLRRAPSEREQRGGFDYRSQAKRVESAWPHHRGHSRARNILRRARCIGLGSPAGGVPGGSQESPASGSDEDLVDGEPVPIIRIVDSSLRVEACPVERVGMGRSGETRIRHAQSLAGASNGGNIMALYAFDGTK